MITISQLRNPSLYALVAFSKRDPGRVLCFSGHVFKRQENMGVFKNESRWVFSPNTTHVFNFTYSKFIGAVKENMSVQDYLNWNKKTTEERIASVQVEKGEVIARCPTLTDAGKSYPYRKKTKWSHYVVKIADGNSTRRFCPEDWRLTWVNLNDSSCPIKIDKSSYVKNVISSVVKKTNYCSVIGFKTGNLGSKPSGKRGLVGLRT